MQFGGGRQDGGDGSFLDGWWKGGSQDVLKGNMSSRICSKDLVDKRVLGRQGKKVVLFEETEVFLTVDSIGKDVKIGMEDGGWRCTSDDIGGAVWDIEEQVVLLVFKSGPDKLGELGDDGLEDTEGNVKGTWVVPSVVRALEDLEDSGGGIHNVLLVNVVKGGPGGDEDVGEGRGGNSSGLRGSEGHFTYSISSI